MSKPGQRQRPAFSKIEPRAPVSPDDIRMKLMEAAAREHADTRTEALARRSAAGKVRTRTTSARRWFVNTFMRH
jgi:hypothetical protein